MVDVVYNLTDMWMMVNIKVYVNGSLPAALHVYPLSRRGRHISPEML